MRRFKITILLILLLNMVQVAAWAASFKIPLRKLAPIQDVRLQGTKDSYRFSVPIPKRWKVRNATFHFKYTNSSALIPLTSRLVFLVHNQPLAQIRLN
ncbi:MAG: cellulose biosynthesis cyclic di-GMP-binding regulatory protein BcsB, partial [Desulfobacterales bacterium]